MAFTGSDMAPGSAYEAPLQSGASLLCDAVARDRRVIEIVGTDGEGETASKEALCRSTTRNQRAQHGRSRTNVALIAQAERSLFTAFLEGVLGSGRAPATQTDPLSTSGPDRHRKYQV